MSGPVIKAVKRTPPQQRETYQILLSDHGKIGLFSPANLRAYIYAGFLHAEPSMQKDALKLLSTDAAIAKLTSESVTLLFQFAARNMPKDATPILCEEAKAKTVMDKVGLFAAETFIYGDGHIPDAFKATLWRAYEDFSPGTNENVDQYHPGMS